MRKIFFVILLLLFVVQGKLYAQNKCIFNIDTMYHICIYYSNYPKLQPKQAYVFVKDISQFSIKTDDYENMVKSFYTNSFWSSSLTSNLEMILAKCYNNIDSKELVDDFYKKTINIKKKHEFNSDKIYLKDSTYIYLSAHKITGVFCKFPISEKNITTIDLEVPDDVSINDYFFVISKIIKFHPLNNEEKGIIRKITNGGNVSD